MNIAQVRWQVVRHCHGNEHLFYVLGEVDQAFAS